jgi:chorismate mutase
MTDLVEAVAEHRRQIDDIDTAMLSLLRQRADVVASLVVVKRQLGAPAVDLSREAVMRTQRREAARSLGLSDEDADALCDALLARGRAWQHR